MSLSIEERIAAVNALDIPPPPSLRSGNDESANVVGGSVISFESGMSASQKEDVMNSTLLAQLSANKLYDPSVQRTQWYTEYKAVLNNVGWIVTDFSNNAVSNASSFGSVDKVVLNYLAEIMTPAEVAAFADIIDTLKTPSNNNAQLLFSNTSVQSEMANFMLGHCSAFRESAGNVSLKIGNYTYHTPKSNKNVLFFNFNNEIVGSVGSVGFTQGHQTMELNEQVYAYVRAAVLQKLGSNALDLINGLDI